MTLVATIEQLEAIYGFPNDASTVKVADRVTPPYRILIENRLLRRWPPPGRRGWIARRAAISPVSSASTMKRR